LFDEAPIPFRPRRNCQLDKAIAQIVSEWDITIPIVHIKNSLFLIGCNRVNCDFKFNSVLVKVGGGSQKLVDYIHKNTDQMIATLVEHMVKSSKQLEWVVDQLVLGKKIPKKFGAQYNFENMSLHSGQKGQPQFSESPSHRASISKFNSNKRPSEFPSVQAS